jgi:hypothetical protein
VPAISILLLGQFASAQSSAGATVGVAPPQQPDELRVLRDGNQWMLSRGLHSGLSIGVSVSPVPPVMSSQLKLPQQTGLVVESVTPGSDGERAGIRQYDVIERANNRRVASPEQVQQMLAGNKAGDRVSLLIVREGDHMNIEVPIRSSPARDSIERSRRNLNDLSQKNLNDFSQKNLPDGFQFSPDQIRQWEQMSEKLKRDVQQQEQQIARLKENLRREADQARRELEQLKQQIRDELEQQKKQMLDQLKEKPDGAKSDKLDQDRDKSDENAPAKR